MTKVTLKWPRCFIDCYITVGGLLFSSYSCGMHFLLMTNSFYNSCFMWLLLNHSFIAECERQRASFERSGFTLMTFEISSLKIYVLSSTCLILFCCFFFSLFSLHRHVASGCNVKQRFPFIARTDDGKRLYRRWTLCRDLIVSIGKGVWGKGWLAIRPDRRLADLFTNINQNNI